MQCLASFPWKKWELLKTTSKGVPAEVLDNIVTGQASQSCVLWCESVVGCSAEVEIKRVSSVRTPPQLHMKPWRESESGCSFYGCCFRWRSWLNTWVWMLPSCAWFYTHCVMTVNKYLATSHIVINFGCLMLKGNNAIQMLFLLCFKVALTNLWCTSVSIMADIYIYLH